MPNDYTPRKDEAFALPPVPALDLYQTGYERFDMEEYGHAVAAPLLARIAELEDRLEESESCLDNAVSKAPEPLRALGEYLGRLLDDDDWPEAERHINAAAISCDRLRAEVEALTAANATLRSVLAECADDLEAEVDARASGELPHRIERDLEPVRKARALLTQPAGTWVNPLAAELEKYRADADRYRWAREHTRFENDCEFWMPSVMAIDFKPGAELNGMHATLDAAIDAARKGEGVAGA